MENIQQLTNDRNEKLKVIYICFPEGKHKVLTFSYDDGRVEDRRLVELFNKYGVRGTFNINGLLGGDDRIQPDEMRSLYEGHEVACHTAQHPTIERCPDEQILLQLLEDRKSLEKRVGYPVRGLAYPNGSYNRRICDMLKYTGICYGRTVKSTGTFAMPDDYTMWNPTAHHNNPELMDMGRDFLNLYKRQYLYMMYVWGHSYEFGERNNWNVIEEFLKLMSGHDDIWYATNIEIYDYMEAAARVRFSADGSFAHNPWAGDIWVEVDKKPVCLKGGEITRLD